MGKDPKRSAKEKRREHGLNQREHALTRRERELTNTERETQNSREYERDFRGSAGAEAKQKTFNRVLMVVMVISLAAVFAQPITFDVSFETSGPMDIGSGVIMPPLSSEVTVTAPFYVWCSWGLSESLR